MNSYSRSRAYIAIKQNKFSTHMRNKPISSFHKQCQTFIKSYHKTQVQVENVKRFKKDSNNA